MYWTFIIIVGVLAFTLSCLRGYYQMYNNEQNYKISQACLLITLCIASFACNLCLCKYGRLLVVLTKESVRLTNGKHESYKAYLKKVSNYTYDNLMLKKSLLTFDVLTVKDN